jgi:hypothetical protein
MRCYTWDLKLGWFTRHTSKYLSSYAHHYAKTCKIRVNSHKDQEGYIPSRLSVKYGDISLSLCIMLRKRVLCIRYLQQKYDGGKNNRHRSSHVVASNESLHDHGWRSINNASVMVSMKNRYENAPFHLSPPPLGECTWLDSWRPKTLWWFEPPFHLNSMKTMCLCKESGNELIWEWLKLKLWGVFIGW